MNESNTPNPGFTFRLMHRAGKYYHIYVILLARLVSGALGLIISSIITRNNSNFSPEQSNASLWATLILMLIGDAVILAWTFYSSKDIITQLEQWKAGKLRSESQVALRAWRQSNTLAWRYGAAAIVISIVVVAIPLLLFQYFSLGATTDQLSYSAFGWGLATIVAVGTSVFAIEYFARPLRIALFPSSFELQIKGVMGLRFRTKLLMATLMLIGFAILALAPLGYSRTYRVLYEEIGSFAVLDEMRGSFILVTAIVLTMSMILVYALSESLYGSVKELIQIFNRIEQGDLKQRARVTASDETGELSIYFNRMLTRIEELQQNLEKRVEDQTEKLRASNEVGRIVSTILNPDDLISQVVNLIAKTFDYYYVAVFLVTGNERWAELVNATGSAGEILKARRHRLQVGGNSMVGNAIASKQAQVAMDVGETAVRFNNPLLPNTRSELALPLMVGDRVIGALDVQSIREADFKADDIATLQNLASQVAISIENARLFREMDNALSELRQSNRQYISSVWEEKLQASKLEYSVKSPAIPGAEEIKDIAVNLNLRDQPIGYIHLQTNEEWSQEDQAWVESLATQVAISLENARLVEESNQSALRERLSASIIQKLWSTPSIDGILQTAVRELGRALEASEATIELKVEES
jgi:GAF domain-containing protein/HAMP domain-containing protein